MSEYMSGQSTEYDPACDKCGGDPALCKCYETEDERTSDKIGVCKDGGKCGIGGYCDDCHSVPAEIEFEGYPGIAHDFESAKQRITEIEKQLAERDAALARFSSVLSSVANAVEKEAFRMEAPNEHTPIFIGIANFARNNNCGLPTSAQATAKVLAAARRFDSVTTASWNYVLTGLMEAIREEQETK